MAGGDGRGPQGNGPMTGRGLGHCAGSDRPGYQADLTEARGRGFGRRHRRGFGRGFGGVRGFGWDEGGYPDEVSRSADTGSFSELAAEVTRLREQLAAMEERLANQT